MREQMPEVSIRSDIGFEEDLLGCLMARTMHMALMYPPQHSSSLTIEQM